MAALSAVLPLAGCDPSGSAPRREAGSGVDPALVTPEPGLTVELEPLPARGELAVLVTIAGPRAALVRELHVARSFAGTQATSALAELEAEDGQGALPLGAPSDDGGDRVIVLGRAPVGERLRLRYRARGATAATRSGYDLRVERDRVLGAGHAFLLLPRLEEALPARIVWRAAALGPRAEGASTFGVGERVETVATSAELGRAIYVAGEVTRLAEGAVSVLSVGRPRLDPREALTFTSRVVHLGHARLEPPGDQAAQPLVVALLSEPSRGLDHDGAFLGETVGLWFDESRGLDTRLRIALAHETFHRHVGYGVRLHGEDGREQPWFSEGMTVHLVRRLLLEERMLSPAELASDLDRTERASSRGGEPGRDEAGYGRGSIYAARLDAALRRRGQRLRSIEQLLTTLASRARLEGTPSLPVSALRELVVRELGAPAGEELDAVQRPEPPALELPGDAFGPCLERKVSEERTFELGFDARSLEHSPAVVRGLVAGSAAERAGLREGTLLLTADVPKTTAGFVTLRVADSGGGRRVRYRPVSTRRLASWRTKACAEAGSTR